MMDLFRHLRTHTKKREIGMLEKLKKNFEEIIKIKEISNIREAVDYALVKS